MKDRKIASVQQLIDSRAYTELYNQSRLTTDTGMAARLRLVCAAIDTTAVFGGQEPCKDVPSSVNTFVQAAHEMLAKPDLAAWVLEGTVPATRRAQKPTETKLDYEALFQKALPIFQRHVGSRVHGVSVFAECGLSAAEAKDLLTWLSTKPEKGVSVEIEVFERGQATGRFFSILDLFSASPRACGFDSDSWRADCFTFVFCFQATTLGGVE